MDFRSTIQFAKQQLMTGLVTVFLSVTVHCQVLVDVGNLSPVQNGSTWQLAYSDLNTALSNAQPGDQIWVKTGTYKPSVTDDRSASFKLNKQLSIYGGFNGTESSLTERDSNSLSILSGDIGVGNDSLDNSYTILLIESGAASSVINGFIFEHGIANDTIIANGFYSSGRAGGAVYFDVAGDYIHVEFSNCIFRKNSAITNGGAVYVSDRSASYSSFPIFDHCVFDSNMATRSGGAIGWFIIRNSQSTAFTKNCVFVDNSATTGGAMQGILTDGLLKIHSTSFSMNNASAVGGALDVFLMDSSQLDIKSSQFYRNGAVQGTGADLYVHSGPDGYQRINVDSCMSTECLAIDNDTIAGLGQFLSGFLISGNVSIVISNSNLNRSGIRLEQGPFDMSIETSGFINTPVLLLSGSDNLNIRNSFFTNSDLQFSMKKDKTYDFVNIVSDNLTNGFLNVVGDTSSTVKVFNSIFNTSDTAHAGYLLVGNKVRLHLVNCMTTRQDLNTAIKTLLPSHDLPKLDTTKVILGTDPLFVDPGSLNYRLVSCSPAINKGLNTIVNAYGITQDIYGYPRIADSFVDLGVHEVENTFKLIMDSVLHIACSNENIGKIFFTAHGVEPLTQQVEDNLGNVLNDYDHLSDGEYILHFEDGSGCQDSVSFDIYRTPPIELTYALSLPKCHDSSDGQVQVYVLTGTPEFQFLWHTGDKTSLIDSLVPGEYFITITDANNCVLEDTIIIPAIEPLDVEITVDQPTDIFSTNGSITIEGSGGSPPYSFIWEDGTESTLREELMAGEYSVTITDDNGCQKASTIVISPISEDDRDRIRMFPNPVFHDETLFLEYFNDLDLDSLIVEVFSVLGQHMTSQKFVLIPGLNTIDLFHTFPNAVYLIRVLAENDHVFKVIVLDN